ncbi:flagellar protein FlgN [Evansella tamaricis]|uniref:Flagellar protein FlgN n=1 Tax=Evansella tamaricis TaxID=2069301 RepID=A0ABS6JDL1_9BACI|nr:flagellar protein FlgN [Evansella tamaricis]
MEKKTQELITIFQAMTALHERFNDKALQKQEAVKKGDIPGLEKVMKEESALIQQLRKLETTRQHAVKTWMEEKGLVKEDITMDALLQFFPEEERKELQHWQQRLVMEIKKLKEQNELNQQLIEESLRFVNISLETVQPQQQFGNYHRPSGKTGEDDDLGSGTRPLFDSKA